MKISDYKGEEALDVLAELIEPAAEIMSDKDIAGFARNGNRVMLIKTLIKNHKAEVIEVMAILEREDPKQYAKKVNLFTLPKKLLEVFNDPDVMSLFTSQGQSAEETSSTSAMESTEESAR